MLTPASTYAGSVDAAVVFQAVYAARLYILPPIENAAVLAREAAAIGSAHGVFFAVDAAFAAFETRRLARCQFAGADALPDTVLLFDLSLIDVVVGLGIHQGRRNNQGRRHCNGREFHRVSPRWHRRPR